MEANTGLVSIDESMNGKNEVTFGELSEMTGFPIAFIKKELLIEEEPISMETLRASMLRYLDASKELFKN